MSDSVRFLAKFVLASVVAFMLYVPLSGTYVAFLSLGADALFGLCGHPASLDVDGRRPYLSYPDIRPPEGPEQGIRIPIFQSVAISFNLIMLVALFVATPHMPYRRKIEGIAVGALLLYVSHIAHIYFISYLFIWGYVAQKSGVAGVSRDELHRLIADVERCFPPKAHPCISGIETYWNSFFREAAPLLIWLYFAYPYLGTGGEPDAPEKGG